MAIVAITTLKGLMKMLKQRPTRKRNTESQRADRLGISPLGSGRKGLLILSISTSKKSLRQLPPPEMKKAEMQAKATPPMDPADHQYSISPATKAPTKTDKAAIRLFWGRVSLRYSTSLFIEKISEISISKNTMGKLKIQRKKLKITVKNLKSEKNPINGVICEISTLNFKLQLCFFSFDFLISLVKLKHEFCVLRSETLAA